MSWAGIGMGGGGGVMLKMFLDKRGQTPVLAKASHAVSPTSSAQHSPFDATRCVLWGEEAWNSMVY